MIKHIVMWKFQPGKDAEVQEVGVNCAPGNYDAVLVSAFDSLEDLEAYKNDPRHQKVSALCKAIRTDRVAVDCEV